MSWDVFISKSPVDQLEKCDFESLGKKDEVIKKLIEILPEATFNDPSWGHYKNEECGINFSLGDSKEQEHIMLHITGGGNSPIIIIKEICERFDCYAMDGSTGEQINFNESNQESFTAWQNYRDKVKKLNK